MESFTVRVTQIYFSKRRLKLLNIFTLSFGLPVFAFLLFIDITGNIPVDLKFIPFLGQTVLTIFVFVFISFALMYSVIKTADKSYHGTIQVDEKGLKLVLGKHTRRLPWTFISNVEITAEEWRLRTKKRLLWVSFEYPYERNKAELILNKIIKEKKLAISKEAHQSTI